MVTGHCHCTDDVLIKSSQTSGHINTTSCLMEVLSGIPLVSECQSNKKIFVSKWNATASIVSFKLVSMEYYCPYVLLEAT